MSEQPTPETEQILTELALGNIGLAAANEKIGRIERERDEAREALEDLLSDGFDHGMTKIRAARKALASLKGGSDE
jgi:hypothetical protein